MRMKGWSAATAALVVACGLTAPGAAAAPRKLEPLNQYVVTGGGSSCRAAGLRPHRGREQSRPGHRGHARQAEDLRNKGFTVTAPYGEEKTAKAAPPDPFATNPTYGFDVYRPWHLKPAPCPGTCSGAVDSAGQPINLQTWYENQRAANPDIVKKVVYGKSRYGQDLVAYKVSLNAHTLTDGAKPVVWYESTQHAREWLATEIDPAPVRPRARQPRPTTRPTSRRCCATRRCGSCRSSTWTATTGPSSTRTPASGGATCATTTTTTCSRATTASTPTATGRRSGATTRRARPTSSGATPTAARRRSPSPRSARSTRCSPSSSRSSCSTTTPTGR